MRKLLLAGVAVVGSMGLAHAQTTTTITTTAAPLPLAPTEGYPAAPTGYLGGNNNINQDGGPMAAGAQNPTPGSVVIHLNGRVWAYASLAGGSGFVNTVTTTVAGHTVTTTNKLNPQALIGYFRLYPGVDAMATNGLRYGAIVEIRQNFIGQNYGSTSAGLNGPGGNFSTSPSGDSCASTLYVRREAVYLGSNSLGIVRIGQDDGRFSQFDNAVTTFQYGSGAWNGDNPDVLPNNAQPTFPFWSGIGAEYAVSKIAYFSPRFAGFDAAVSYAPSNTANNASAGGCLAAGPGCAALSSSSTTTFGGAGRPTNWMEAMARYQGTFNGFGVYGIAGYSASGNTKSTAAGSQQFNGFSVGDVGLTLSYAGFSVGGNVLFGNYNSQVALQPKGGVGAVAWLGGVSYQNGPFQAYGSYYNFQYQGACPAPSCAGVGQRYDDAFWIGTQYAIAPGLNAYAEYAYGESHQGGVNLLTGAAGPTALNSGSNNNVHTQSLIIGTRVQW
jgi:Gram-negative porin